MSERCERCHWPLAKSVAEGCAKGNCSYRPGRPITVDMVDVQAFSRAAYAEGERAAMARVLACLDDVDTVGAVARRLSMPCVTVMERHRHEAMKAIAAIRKRIGK